MLFFAISTIMGFYGAGMVAFLIAFVFVSIRFTLIKFLKTLTLFSLLLVSFYYLIAFISPDTLRYNKNIIYGFLGKNDLPIPRKLLSYSNYVKGYTSEIDDFIFGSGPGTFNSRSAFIVGSPEYFANAGILKSDEQLPGIF